MKKILLTALIMGAFAATSFAQSRTPYIHNKRDNQHDRIRHGARSGSLTAREARMLRMQQRDIDRTIRMAKADGVITPRERALIRQKQRMANRNIYVQNHDRQHRW